MVREGLEESRVREKESEFMTRQWTDAPQRGARGWMKEMVT